MMMRRHFLLSSFAVCGLAACAPAVASGTATAPRYPVQKSDAEWRKLLSPESYEVLRNKGTERAFTGKTWNEHRAGVYRCAGCATPLFSAQTKFESGTGWPSFYAPLSDKAVQVATDTTYGMVRDEVVCATCGGHLGHVFDDGPKPTGKRYCMNSAALAFVPEGAAEAAAGPAATKP